MDPWLLPVELPGSLEGHPEPATLKVSPPVMLSGSEIVPGRGELLSGGDADIGRPCSEHRRVGRRFLGPLAWLFMAALVWLVGVWFEDSYQFLLRQFDAHWSLGLMFTLLEGVVLVSLVVILVREVVSYLRMQTQEAMRREIQTLWREGGHGRGASMAARIRHSREWPGDGATDAWRDFYQTLQGHHNDREILELVSRLVYTPLDGQCYALIVRHGTAAAIFSAMSPYVWLDSLIFLWRNLQMIREIAACYGPRPGWTGSLLLARSVATGLVMTGTADLVTDQMVDAVGGHATSLILAHAGKGIATAMFTARVGLNAMVLCRPVPFSPKAQPSMEQLRPELLGAIRETLGMKSAKK